MLLNVRIFLIQPSAKEKKDKEQNSGFIRNKVSERDFKVFNVMRKIVT